MRRAVKVLANFLGAAKELTGEYVELAEITDDEQNQIRMSVMSRPDRKEAARLLSAKGLSTREIAGITGWSQGAIARDLRESKESKSESNDSLPPATGSEEIIEHRAQVAEAAAAEGETEAPDKQYRIIYADPPWDYGAHLQPDYQTEQRDHYPVMPLAPPPITRRGLLRPSRPSSGNDSRSKISNARSITTLSSSPHSPLSGTVSFWSQKARRKTANDPRVYRLGVRRSKSSFVSFIGAVLR